MQHVRLEVDGQALPWRYGDVMDKIRYDEEAGRLWVDRGAFQIGTSRQAKAPATVTIALKAAAV